MQHSSQITGYSRLPLALAGSLALVLLAGGCRRHEVVEAENRDALPPPPTSVDLTTPGAPEAAANEGNWRQQLADELPVLGHRNWIVIADSAYPAQSNPGIETLYTGARQLEVVQAVLEALDKTKHVKPVVYLDAEMPHVPEGHAAGVSGYRTELTQLLRGRRVTSLPHEELIAKLDAAAKVFRILVLKTDLTIPYTSVFVELDCGYWGPEAEQALREAMKTKR
jgi:D-ribose pyranose/furanose isomerase RbsD